MAQLWENRASFERNLFSSLSLKYFILCDFCAEKKFGILLGMNSMELEQLFQPKAQVAGACDKSLVISALLSCFLQDTYHSFTNPITSLRFSICGNPLTTAPKLS